MKAIIAMPVHSNLQFLLARVNLERAQRGESILSLRQLSIETGIAHSVLTTLAADRNQRIDYGTIDKLLTFFNNYFSADTGDLLVWTTAPKNCEVDS